MGRLVGGSPAARNATERAIGMLDKIGTTGEKLVCGGGHSKELRMIEPTVVLCGWDSELMQEELFCPILCVIPYCNLKDAAVKVLSSSRYFSSTSLNRLVEGEEELFTANFHL